MRLWCFVNAGKEIQIIHQTIEKLIQIIHQRNKDDVNCLCIHQKEAEKLGRNQTNFISSELILTGTGAVNVRRSPAEYGRVTSFYVTLNTAF